MSQSLILYTRPECELCERAAEVAEAAGANWAFMDITSDIELLRRYRVRIPVLADPETGQEIGWPFDEAAVRELLGNRS
jgi:glutaredoxin